MLPPLLLLLLVVPVLVLVLVLCHLSWRLRHAAACLHACVCALIFRAGGPLTLWRVE
jgi:hypothetical protein